MSISLSTYFHSTEARSSAKSLLKPGSSDGEYSNHVKKSKGSLSPRSRQWWRRRATAGRYWAQCECDGTAPQKSSGVRLEPVPTMRGFPDRDQGGTGGLCSTQTWLLRHETILLFARHNARYSLSREEAIWCPKAAAKQSQRLRRAGDSGRGAPATASIRTTRQTPVSPPANVNNRVFISFLSGLSPISQPTQNRHCPAQPLKQI